MSGGSYGYCYSRVEEAYCNRMYDAEMEAMMSDLVDVLHDLDWWRSADYCEEDYRKSVKKFKDKWFKQSREERLAQIIDDKCKALRDELTKII